MTLQKIENGIFSLSSFNDIAHCPYFTFGVIEQGIVFLFRVPFDTVGNEFVFQLITFKLLHGKIISRLIDFLKITHKNIFVFADLSKYIGIVSDFILTISDKVFVPETFETGTGTRHQKNAHD